ncbi:MAG: hypothetical protein AB7Q45_27425 [Planctomycetaceae bacterium]
MIRDDLSDKLIHLTRGSTYAEAAAVFSRIIEEARLIGGTGCIKGGFQCVCFSEAPISQLSRILANPMAHGMRYMPFGVMVDKAWLFDLGGRPVIYQTESEYRLLHDDQKYRHVRYDPMQNVDYTWEREWRILTAELTLDPEVVTVVVPNREWERNVLKPHEGKIWRRAAASSGVLGGGIPSVLIKQPWHFIVLEDLGVRIPTT